MYKQAVRLFKLSLIVVAIAPLSVFAHLNSEALKDNGYQFEIGQFPAEQPLSGKSTFFAIRFELENGNAVNNGEAWIRISKGDEILFSSSDFVTDDATIDFEYMFPDQGEYELTIRFIDSKTKEEATIKKMISVELNPEQKIIAATSSANQKQSNFNLAVLTFVFGALGGIILSRAAPFMSTSKDTSGQK